MKLVVEYYSMGYEFKQYLQIIEKYGGFCENLHWLRLGIPLIGEEVQLNIYEAEIN